MFNNRIKHILTEELLREAASLEKIVNAITKNNPDDGSASEIGQLIMADPTSVSNDRGKFVGRYWKWIYNQYKQGNIHEGDIPELRVALNTYNINKSQINKPIDSYDTLDELVEEIAQYNDSFKAGRTISKGEQELEKVYEDQYVVVYIPHTVEAARKIGGDTRWCTASPTSGDQYFNMYLNDYGGEYYDIIRKLDGAKFQIHPESNQFMDREDKPVNFACVFSSKKEADGLIRFLENKGKDIEKWKPKTWFDEVEEKLTKGFPLYFVFDSVFDERSDIMRVKLNKKFNFINKDRKLLSPDLWFDGVKMFYNGFGQICLNNKWNLIGKDGKIVSQDKWFDFVTDFYEGFSRVRLNKKSNIIKTDGTIISPDLWFDEILFDEGDCFKVEIKDKYNWMKRDGNLFSDKWFDITSDFWDGISCVKRKNKWNFIDIEGNLLSNKWYDQTYVFSEGFGGVMLNDKHNWIDKNGKLLSKKWFDTGGNFKHGFATVTIGNKWNYIGKDGKILSPNQWFDFACGFAGESGYVGINKKWYKIFPDGKLVPAKQ